jgi:hypothetical protein
VFRGGSHWSLSWAIWIQFITSHSIYVPSISILTFCLYLGLPSGLFLLKFCTHFLYACYISLPYNFSPFHRPSNITVGRFKEKQKLWIPNTKFLPVTSCLLCTSIFLSTIDGHYRSLSRSGLFVSDHHWGQTPVQTFLEHQFICQIFSAKKKPKFLADCIKSWNKQLFSVWFWRKSKVKVKLSRYTPWRHKRGEEV